jgi:hypothetical protein
MFKGCSTNDVSHFPKGERRISKQATDPPLWGRKCRPLRAVTLDLAPERKQLLPPSRGGLPCLNRLAAQETNLKRSLGEIALVPFGAVTVTSTTPAAAAGDVAEIDVAEFTV